jgi:hypothetical protein
MSVGAQDIGQHVGVARIGLAAGRAVAWATGFDDIGMDGHDRVACRREGFDDEAAGTLDGHWQGFRSGDPLQPPQQFGQPRRRVGAFEPDQNGAVFIECTDGMAALQRGNQDEASASIKVRGTADPMTQRGRSPTGGIRSASA